MRIVVQFHFENETEPVATTGVEGHVTDFIVPCIGDMVQHRTRAGNTVLGRVKERIYVYALKDGSDIDGIISVTVVLEKLTLH